MNIRLVSAIWGSDFVNMFLRVGLRSLLAEGNLPDLARTHRVNYTIYTTQEDANSIEASSAFQRLRKSVRVDLVTFALGEINHDRAASHVDLWLRALELARRNREILFLIIPDILYATGTLARWARRFEEGYAAVYTPGPFVCLETVMPELEKDFPANDMNITIEPDKIIDLIFRHLHPLEGAMLRNAPRRAAHPEHDIRPVKDRGFVMRVYTSQPFCIDPVRFNRLRHFNPEDHLDSICLEPCTTASVEPILKSAGWYYHGNPLDRIQISQLGRWWAAFSPPGCVKESLFTYEFTSRNDSVWKEGLDTAVTGSRMLRTQIRAASVISCLWQELTLRGHYWSGAIIATAHFAAKLRRRIQIRSNAVLLLPRDSAFSGQAADALWPLLVPGREPELVHLIREHIFIPVETSNGGASWQTANGRAVQGTVLKASIRGEPFFVEGFAVYMIDRVLMPESASATGQAVEENGGSVAGGAEIAITALPAPTSNPAPGLVRRAVSTVRLGASGLRQNIRAIGRKIFLRYSPAASNLLQRTYLRLEPIPVIGPRLARRGRRAAEIIRIEGWPGIRLRLVRKARGLARLARLRQLLSVIPRFIKFVQSGLHYVRQHGFWMSWWRTQIWLRSFTAFSNDGKYRPRQTLPATDVEMLGRIRQVRALQAARDILSHYQSETFGSAKPSEPLRWTDAKLKKLESVPGGAAQVLRQRLVTLTKRHPAWSEAWLELGYLQLEEGDETNALQSFTRATAGYRLSDLELSNRNPQLDAHAARGRLLAARGALDEAKHSFPHALAYKYADGMVNIDLGHLLWSRGEGRKAARYFFYGMVYDPVTWTLPKCPRNAQTLDFEALTSK